MKNTIKFIASGAMITWATGTFAAGNHAGGHGTASIGQPGLASAVTRTIEVTMADTMRFTPSEVKVTQGETIRFVVTNAGQLKHEFNLGTDADLKAHAEQMKKFPEMEHDEPNLVSLAPGKKGEVIWKFTRSGPVNFACLHVGHFDAGMKGRVLVAQAELASGEVKKIDKATQKITLKHGEIKSLDMPPMTMVFKVTDVKMLDQVKVGDNIKFNAEQRDGSMVVTTLQTVK